MRGIRKQNVRQGSANHLLARFADQYFAVLALAPALILLVVLSLPPTVGALALAFRNNTLSARPSHWAGWLNFRQMLQDDQLASAFETSAVWEVMTVAGTMIVAIIVGIAIFEMLKGRLRDVTCLALLLPALLPRVSVGMIWRYMYSPLMGVVNYPLTLLHLAPIEFLSQPSLALYSVAAVDVWQWGLFFGVIVFKLIQTLPPGPREAAKIDSASSLMVHWFISLPMLRSALITIAFITGVESLRSFDLIYTMTNGGPGTATQTLDLYAYQVGIALNGRISYAAAMSVLLLIATIIIFSFLWKRAQRWST
jgi:multiple sugar transport system permease protein